MSKLRHIHWVFSKHVLRYLCGTIAYGTRYTSSAGVMLHGNVDFDCVGSTVDMKSTFRIVLAWV